MTDKLATVILAAGKGTRMNSQLPKVLHKICGRSMAERIITTADQLNSTKNIAVIGYQSEVVKSELEDLNVEFAYQPNQLGTGHAVMQTEEQLADFDGSVLVLCGDTPLLTAKTLEQLVTQQQQSNTAATVLSTKVDDPTGYGRIVRDESGDLLRIVEEQDASNQEAEIKEVNTGTYCFDSQLLFSALDQLDTDNQQGEYYLTDIIEIFTQEGQRVKAVITDDQTETLGVNTKEHLATAEQTLRRRICNQHLAAGVKIIDPANTYIDEEVAIGQDAVIYPFTFLEGQTEIGSQTIIGPQSRIIDAKIGSNVEVEHSVIREAEIESGVTVGPFAYIRPETKLGTNSKAGSFVEIKKSEVGADSKVPHLSYIGDTTIGEQVNIGAGTITANYDGVEKNRTEIADNTFVGSDSTLIAPLTIGQGAITGAGSVVTKDVADDTLVLGVPAKECKSKEEKKE
ncbi:MAG: bifunctional UDP-N-acetylglucosamine diphosphorylase/glucosamine-1-phosphate N-acetyltransferase GlmU [Bacillota bacterium]